MTSRRILLENIAALSVLQTFNYIAPLLTVPYLVRVLKPADFGMLSFAQGLILYFDLITDYGFNFSATRSIAAQRDDWHAVSRTFWSTLAAKVLLMLASAVAVTALVTLIPRLRERPSLYAATFLYVVGTALFPVWLFQGLERIKTAALSLGIARMMTVPALLIFVHSRHDYVKAAAIQASVQLAATLFILPVLLRTTPLRWYRPSLPDLVETFKAGWPLFISGSALYLSTSSTTVVLGFAAGKEQVGYYGAAEKLIKAVSAALNPISQALYPHITAAKRTSANSALRLIRTSLFSTGVLSCCASIATLLLAKPICHIFLGPSFNESVYVLRWLSPLPLLFGLISVFGTQTMLVFGLDKIISRIMLGSAVFAFPMILVLSAAFAARGAAIASVALASGMLIAMISALHARGLVVSMRKVAHVLPSELSSTQ